MHPHRCSSVLTSLVLTLLPLLTTALPAWSQSRGTNYIHNIRGTVVTGRFLIRPDRAYEGAVLSTEHQIRLEGNSWVTLECSNGGSHALDTGTYAVSSYCNTPNSRRPGALNPSRDPFDTALPYVISPRNTALLTTDRLTLRWHPVPNATQYQVTITGPGVDWTTTVTQPEATYSGAATFRPDYRYSVVITANSGPSSVTGSSIGFTVLPPEEVSRVSRQVNQVKTSHLQPDVEAIALALVYGGYEHSERDRHSYALNHLAIDSLQQRIDAGTSNSQIYLLQADTYLTIGLPLAARERYLTALALAEASNLLEPQAESHVGLGFVAAGQTEYSDAIFHLTMAQAIYQDLGDLAQVEVLKAQIEQLSDQVPQASTPEAMP